MFLVGEIKGVLVAHFVRQFEHINGLEVNCASDAKVHLYRGSDKSVMALQDGNNTIRIEVPNEDRAEICISTTFITGRSIASVLSSKGESTIAFGEWCEHDEGVGFCSDGPLVQNTALSINKGQHQYEHSRNFLRILELSFD